MVKHIVLSGLALPYDQLVNITNWPQQIWRYNSRLLNSMSLDNFRSTVSLCAHFFIFQKLGVSYFGFRWHHWNPWQLAFVRLFAALRAISLAEPSQTRTGFLVGCGTDIFLWYAANWTTYQIYLYPVTPHFSANLMTGGKIAFWPLFTS